MGYIRILLSLLFIIFAVALLCKYILVPFIRSVFIKDMNEEKSQEQSVKSEKTKTKTKK